MKEKHEPKIRKGFRRISYMAGTPEDPRNGVWQWRYGGTVVLYSPSGRRFLSRPGELVGWQNDEYGGDHYPVAPSDVIAWIDKYGRDEDVVGYRKCRKKFKEDIWGHNGALISVTRVPSGDGREKVYWKVVSTAGEVVKTGECRPETTANVDRFVQGLKDDMDRQVVDDVVEAMEAMFEAACRDDQPATSL